MDLDNYHSRHLIYGMAFPIMGFIILFVIIILKKK